MGGYMIKSNKMPKKNRLLENAHQIAKSLHEVGIIDITTMREFDAACLPPVKEFSSQEIKKIRLREKLSQPVFAKYLNTTTSTIKQWEIGEKHPRGTSLKLLNLIEKKGIQILI